MAIIKSWFRFRWRQLLLFSFVIMIICFIFNIKWINHLSSNKASRWNDGNIKRWRPPAVHVRARNNNFKIAAAGSKTNLSLSSKKFQVNDITKILQSVTLSAQRLLYFISNSSSLRPRKNIPSVIKHVLTHNLHQLYSPIDLKPLDLHEEEIVSVDRDWPDAAPFSQYFNWREVMTYTTDRLPENIGERPPLGNGYLGTMAFESFLRISGIFVGSGSKSRLANIPALIMFNITEANIQHPYHRSSQHRQIPSIPLFITRLYHHNIMENAFTQYMMLQDLPVLDHFKHRTRKTDHLNVTAMDLDSRYQFIVIHRVYPHARLLRVLVQEVEIWTLLAPNNKEGAPSTLKLKMNFLAPSSVADVTFQTQSRQGGGFANKFLPIFHELGRCHSAENANDSPQTFHVIHSPVPRQLNIPLPTEENKPLKWKFTFLMSVDVDGTNAWRQFIIASNLVESGNLLYASHVIASQQHWSSSGLLFFSRSNLVLMQSTIWSQYLLFVNTPPASLRNTSVGLPGIGFMSSRAVERYVKIPTRAAPEELHVTWGQELWIQPWLMLMQPESSLQLILYRLQQLPASKQNALHVFNGQGYSNETCLFPREATHSGNELNWYASSRHSLLGTVASGRPSRLDEVNGFFIWTLLQHLFIHNRTISLNMFPQLSTNKDPSQITVEACLKCVAHWFASRLYQRQNTSKAFEIDEFEDSAIDSGLKQQSSSVSKSILRNPLLLIALAKLSLQAPQSYHKFQFGDKDWQNLLFKFLADKGNRLFVTPHISTRDDAFRNALNIFLPQHDDYRHGQPVTFTEVASYVFPLAMARDVDEKHLAYDLENYEKSLSALMSCMNYASHAIVWLQLRKPDRARGPFLTQLRHCFLSAKNGAPFPVWHDVSAASLPLFTKPQSSSKRRGNLISPSLYPGSAFLQSLLFGYWGIRVDIYGLHLQPVLPTEVQRSMHIRGLHYMGCILDLDYGYLRTGNSKLYLKLVLRSHSLGASHLIVKHLHDEESGKAFSDVGGDIVLEMSPSKMYKVIITPTNRKWRSADEVKVKAWQHENKFIEIEQESERHLVDVIKKIFNKKGLETSS